MGFILMYVNSLFHLLVFGDGLLEPGLASNLNSRSFHCLLPPECWDYQVFATLSGFYAFKITFICLAGAAGRGHHGTGMHVWQSKDSLQESVLSL